MRNIVRGELAHGKVHTYRSYGCRCDECRDAHHEATKQEKERRRLRLLADHTLAPHGQVNTYRNWACRCDECKEAEKNRPDRQPGQRPSRAGTPRAKEPKRKPYTKAPARKVRAEPFGREWMAA